MVATFQMVCKLRFVHSKAFPKTSDYRSPDALSGRLLPWHQRLTGSCRGTLFRLFPSYLRSYLGKRPTADGTSMTARTRFLDESVRSAMADGAKQLIILGAGLDTRPGRLRDVLKCVRVFEVDLPNTQAAKRAALHRAGLSNDWGSTFVPVDFNNDNWPDALREAGCVLGNVRTHVLWEGCMYYLPEEAVKATLRALRKPGVSISFDMFTKDVLGDTKDTLALALADFVRAIGEPFLSGIDFKYMEDWAAEQGWEVTDVLRSPEDISARFFPDKKAGLEPFSSHGMASMRPILF